MRLAPALLVVSVLLAGCASDPAPGSEVPSPTSSPADAAPAAPVFEGIHLTHDHAEGMTEETNFTLPAGLGPLRFEVYFEGPEGTSTCVAPETDPARVVVKDPSGEVRADVKASMVSNWLGNDRCPGGVSEERIHLPAGAWTVTFSGRAVLTGFVSVQPADTE